MIQIYDTLQKTKRPLEPLEPGRVNMYCCGITPYDYSHLGHARGAVFFDVVRRYLEARGYAVNYIRNVTDVDDKIIARAAERNEDPLELSRRFTEAYHEDAARLGVRPPTVEPTVSGSIDVIIELIEKLIEKGTAYAVSSGDVYFRVRHFDEYGKLSGRNVDEMRAGARVKVGEAKEDPADFALWKAAKPGEIMWDSPWGAGRPGWHIECSAMALKYAGGRLDIHGGGEDLIFPHHENEIAQSEGAGFTPYVGYWMHNGMIRVESEKMSKSLGNFFTIRDILDKFPAMIVRYYILNAHYRSPLDFADARLEEAGRSYARFTNFFEDVERLIETERPNALEGEARAGGEEIARARTAFHEAMEDDFNTARAIAVLLGLVGELNALRAARPDDPVLPAVLHEGARTIRELGGILGLFETEEEREESIPEEILNLLEERQAARKQKNFARADKIRDELLAKGYEIKDTPQGPILRPVQ